MSLAHVPQAAITAGKFHHWRAYLVRWRDKSTWKNIFYQLNERVNRGEKTPKKQPLLLCFSMHNWVWESKSISRTLKAASSRCPLRETFDITSSTGERRKKPVNIESERQACVELSVNMKPFPAFSILALLSYQSNEQIESIKNAIPRLTNPIRWKWRL